VAGSLLETLGILLKISMAVRGCQTIFVTAKMAAEKKRPGIESIPGRLNYL
jgi:hypothetical protein